MNQEQAKETLHEFYVAGVKYHELYTCIAEVEVGETLIMIQETDPEVLKYDPNAVRLYHSSHHEEMVMVGFVPARQSAQVSALLEVMSDVLIAEVIEVNPKEKPWFQLKVAIKEVQDA